ncbi:MAG: hypothetical protein LBN18_04805 [Dysgonamonadaceae bacterium]|jgi:hypothetical protein|nr:hypothetical protein [Dysgonamonadaceae bacterium]
MTTIAITPKSRREYAFLITLFQRMNLKINSLSEEDVEDIGLLQMMQEVDRRDVVSEDEIMKMLG